MKSMIPSVKMVMNIFSLAVGATLATTAYGTDCYRYISFDGKETKINIDCAEQLGVTPIFVRDRLDGYDILVPPMSGLAPYDRLPAASVEWLSAPTNLDRMERVIDFAERTSDIYPLTSEGGLPKIEYVNYTLASWLNTSGATAAIASLASKSNLSASTCQSIPVCTSCEYYFCYWDDSSPYKQCWCHFVGWNCCVIGRTLEPPAY